MREVVWVTLGGARFHRTADCPMLDRGQLLNDVECGDEVCRHRHPRPRRVEGFPTFREALRAGFTPCRGCWPDGFDLECGESFGHFPVLEGPESAPVEARRRVCARCTVWTHWADVGLSVGRRVGWPCTSAKVLGLVSREARG